MAADTSGILALLPKDRLRQLALTHDVRVASSGTAVELATALGRSGRLSPRVLAERLFRDELRAACKHLAIPFHGQSRAELAASFLEALGDKDSTPPVPLFGARDAALRPGALVRARHRQWLVLEVSPPADAREQTRVSVVCLDDDDAGRRAELVWERELGAKVIEPHNEGLGKTAGMDDPRAFAAYYRSLLWAKVTAGDASLLQSPFRAGIKLYNHQLTPLRKALALPRANLFIADDVGLGKTIEAGLVASELALRQRVDFMLIVCPASVALQWKSEMQRRFGLSFEIYSKAFVQRQRRERGFSVLPFSTSARFILTYPLLRRPEYKEPLFQFLGDRRKKSLLIMDEAHTAAPATSARYAVDSAVTKTVRELAPRFENRLFLSATPHNGHSNSFSSLLEILDSQRFTRGVPITSEKELEPVMVRRLKSDLRSLDGAGSFPERKVVRVDVGSATCPEVRLSELLAEYTELAAPKKGRGRFPFVSLQKRLLSSVEAFARTLEKHAKGVYEKGRGPLEGEGDQDDDEAETVDDDALVDRLDEATFAASLGVGTVEGRARELLEELRRVADRSRGKPCEKARAFVAWVRENLFVGEGKKAQWGSRRVIVFTEYVDTLRVVQAALDAAFGDTARGDERVLTLTGSLGEDERDERQRAFNAPPDEHPVRILLCTDAAREGLNLQAHCADLFHFDMPWNPGRMEQRNGRIDRTLQPEPEVRCHYFVYPDRHEDVVLARVLYKVATIRRELGSLSAVVDEAVTRALDDGIGKDTETAIAKLTQADEKADTTRRELETSREITRLKKETDASARALQKSRVGLRLSEAALRDLVDEGLKLAGTRGLQPIPGQRGAYRMPELPPSWVETLDSLRVPRRRDEPLWDWRRKPLLPVVFEPPALYGDAQVHLHLAHPVVLRILSRFRAQGHSAHDLSRVTVVRSSEAVARVVCFGRLSLFGEGARILHDELVSVAGDWFEAGGEGHLVRYEEEKEQRLLDALEALWDRPNDVPAAVQKRLVASARGDFSHLWGDVAAEAEDLARKAEQALDSRGKEEARALLRILDDQRTAIARTLEDTQVPLFLDAAGAAESAVAKRERAQWDDERRAMRRRLEAIERERETEPRDIEQSYRVLRKRLVPVGLVYLWPDTRG
jgi:superfamily II DNA or RNA helicase